VTWWCSATGELWTWTWRAYPGVWLFVGLLLGCYWWAVRRTGGPADRRTVGPATVAGPQEGISPARPPVRPSAAWYLMGVLCVWLALDWPIGALGAGYLASFHTVSYILLALVAPPCLILGIPRAVQLQGLGNPLLGPILRLAARPWFALTLFNLVLFLTHIPDVLDGLMSSQIGALLIDLGWLLGGLALWWPVMGPSPELVTMRRPMKMAYLFASTLPPIIPSAFLTFAQYPLYATYELAPRVFPILTAQQDQQVAGLLMKLVGDLPVWFAFGVIFFRWARESTSTPPPAHPDSLRVVGSSR
jgi:putative membrane protein